MYGWTGKIISIDLTERKLSLLDTGDYCKLFLGGLGIGEKIYFDMTNTKRDAFHPSNLLILMTGPLAATPAPSSPRLSVCGKSPCIYPETFVSASLGGFFAAELKKAGYDGIVIQGRADTPVYIQIDDKQITIKNASHLWGLTNSKTRQALQKEVGENCRIISIGPGAENPTRIGIIFTDAGGAGSMGFGSVMGSKNLKAITVQGSGTIRVADTQRILNIRKRLREMRGEGFFNLFGTPLTLPGISVIKKIHCHGCPEGCWRTLQRSESGQEDIRKCQIGIFYTPWDKRFHGQPTETSFYATTLANDHSLCVLELAFLLMWLDKCFAKGILTEKDTELPYSKIGSKEFLETMIRKICLREGFGAVLAEGTIRASEIVGEESREITRNLLTPSGRAIAYGPKVFFPSAIIYATEPRPSITELHEICEPLTKWAIWYKTKGEKSYVSTEVLKKIAQKFWGSEEAVDFSTYEGKALAAYMIQNRQFLKESLILCDFAWPVYDDASSKDHVGDPTLEYQLLSAVIGKEIVEQEANQLGERIFTLNRVILLREGRKGKEDDVLPDFMFKEQEDPIADVFGMHNPELLVPGPDDKILSRKGKAIDRKKFEEMREEYYRLRGWDPQTGIPTLEKLKDLGLGDVAHSWQPQKGI